MGFRYLAMPWAKLSDAGKLRAWDYSMSVFHHLSSEGFSIFHPIAQGASLASWMSAYNKPEFPHELWLKTDTPFLAAATSLIVLAEIPGWEDSVGVAYEIAYMQKAGKGIFYLYNGVHGSDTPYHLSSGRRA
jgi:hypothetical protein